MHSDYSHAAPFGTEPIWPGFPSGSFAVDDPLHGGVALEHKATATAPSRDGSHEVAALRQVLGAVAASLDPPDAVRTVLREVIAASGATAGSLWLFQPGGGIARVAHAGLTREYLSVFAGMPDWATVQADLGRIGDVAIHDDGYLPWLPERYRQTAPLLGVRAVAVLPLCTRGLRVGLIVIGHSQPGWFRGLSVAFLRTLADLVATALDNARLLAEARLRDADVPVDLMLAALDIGVALCAGPDCELRDHNPAFARLLGAGEAVLRCPLRERLPQGDTPTILAAAQRAIRDGRRVTVPDVEVRWPDRDAGFWNVAATPLPAGAPDRPSRVLLTITDVTERRALEDRYRHAQKLEAVGTLAGGIAHEFNNLLTAILGQVSLALFDLPPDHPLVAGLRDCETAALRAADLTRQLLGFGRRAPVRLRPTDLRRVVDEALPLFQHAIDPRIVVEREDDAGLWTVQADGAQIGQALMNLCVNARDAMPSGGCLRLRLRNEILSGANAPRRGEFVVLEVGDSGHGMPPEVRARIFEPFFTTKGPDRGTGLGLSVVHGIVEQHRGWVECDSQPDVGTTFRLFLPRLAEPRPPLEHPMGRGETVLVVDDELALRSLSRSILERLGYRVLLAADGEEALRVFREHLDEVGLVLLDLTMPRLSGPETLVALRALSGTVRVVFTSGYDTVAGGPVGASGDADGFLAKPYSPEQVATAVRAALDSTPRAADTAGGAPA